MTPLHTTTTVLPIHVGRTPTRATAGLVSTDFSFVLDGAPNRSEGRRPTAPGTSADDESKTAAAPKNQKQSAPEDACGRGGSQASVTDLLSCLVQAQTAEHLDRRPTTSDPAVELTSELSAASVEAGTSKASPASPPEIALAAASVAIGPARAESAGRTMTAVPPFADESSSSARSGPAPRTAEPAEISAPPVSAPAKTHTQDSPPDLTGFKPGPAPAPVQEPAPGGSFVPGEQAPSKLGGSGKVSRSATADQDFVNEQRVTAIVAGSLPLATRSVEGSPQGAILRTALARTESAQDSPSLGPVPPTTQPAAQPGQTSAGSHAAAKAISDTEGADGKYSAGPALSASQRTDAITPTALSSSSGALPSPAQQVAGALQGLGSSFTASASPTAAASPAAPPPSSTTTRETVGAASTQSLTVQLNPEHLGPVAITLRMVSGRVEVKISVATTDALHALERDRHVIQAAVEAAGGSQDSLMLAGVQNPPDQARAERSFPASPVPTQPGGEPAASFASAGGDRSRQDPGAPQRSASRHGTDDELLPAQRPASVHLDGSLYL